VRSLRLEPTFYDPDLIEKHCASLRMDDEGQVAAGTLRDDATWSALTAALRESLERKLGR